MKKFLLLSALVTASVTDCFYNKALTLFKTSKLLVTRYAPLIKKNIFPFLKKTRFFKVAGIYTVVPGVFASPVLWQEYQERQKAENYYQRFMSQEEGISGL